MALRFALMTTRVHPNYDGEVHKVHTRFGDSGVRARDSRDHDANHPSIRGSDWSGFQSDL